MSGTRDKRARAILGAILVLVVVLAASSFLSSRGRSPEFSSSDLEGQWTDSQDPDKAGKAFLFNIGDPP